MALLSGVPGRENSLRMLQVSEAQGEKALKRIRSLPGREKSLASPANLPCRDSSCLLATQINSLIFGRQFFRCKYYSWFFNNIITPAISCPFCAAASSSRTLDKLLKPPMWDDAMDLDYISTRHINSRLTSCDPMEDEEMLIPRCKGDICSSEQFEHTICTCAPIVLTSS